MVAERKKGLGLFLIKAYTICLTPHTYIRAIHFTGETRFVLQDLLLRAKSRCNTNMEETVVIPLPELWTLVSQGQVYEVRQLLENGADVSTRNTFGQTLLHAVCDDLDWFADEHSDNLDIVQLLIQFHSDCSATDHFGNTPIHSAAWAGDSHAVALLIEQGVDASAKNSRGQTPLMWSAAQIDDEAWVGHCHVARRLLGQGADVMDRDHIGNSPLHIAAESGHLKMVKLLLNHGADVTAENEDKKTPLDVSTDRRSGPAWKNEEVKALFRTALMEEAHRKETRQNTWGAFMMGHHERLGVNSIIKAIPPELAYMILNKIE